MTRRRVNPRTAMRGGVRASSCKIDRATPICDEKPLIQPVQDHFRHPDASPVAPQRSSSEDRRRPRSPNGESRIVSFGPTTAMTSQESKDERSDPLTNGPLPAWATGFGRDHCGVFVEFTVGIVVQRMRWIPPGWF